MARQPISHPIPTEEELTDEQLAGLERPEPDPYEYAMWVQEGADTGQFDWTDEQEAAYLRDQKDFSYEPPGFRREQDFDDEDDDGDYRDSD